MDRSMRVEWDPDFILYKVWPEEIDFEKLIEFVDAEFSERFPDSVSKIKKEWEQFQEIRISSPRSREAYVFIYETARGSIFGMSFLDLEDFISTLKNPESFTAKDLWVMLYKG